MAAWWLGRRQAWATAPAHTALRFLFALFVLGCLSSALSPALSPVPVATLLLPLGSAVLLSGAAFLGVRASRLRGRAEALRALAPQDVDEAVASLQGRRRAGVFRGRLGARGAVTSPAGLVCAFYESELRAAESGGAGTLLTRERAQASLVSLRGERHEVVLAFTPDQVLAPREPRRCQASASMASMDPRVPAGAEPVEAALSFERVGRIGEPCLVVGALEPGPVPGRYGIKGLKGGPALLVLGSDAQTAGAQLARRAWALLGGACALVVAAAFLLSRL
jgi:hypothetical protein